jgi:uncharacterized membrane protein
VPATYLLVKWLHVLLAIVALGTNLTYGVILTLGGRMPQHMPFALRLVKVLDSRLANPGYVLLLATGLWLTWLASIPLATFWVAASLVLYALAALMGLLLYAPLLRRQRALLAEGGRADSPAFLALAKKGAAFGILVTLDVVAIVYLMVVKPTAPWG